MRLCGLVLFLLVSGSLVAQPLLETGAVLQPGDVLSEDAVGGWPLDYGASGYYGFAQYQVQFGWPKKSESTRWEPRAALATGYSPDQVHFSALLGAQFHLIRTQNDQQWDWSIAATTSYLKGNQLIPQHKAWFAGTSTVGSTVWNVNGGICQNRSGDPIHWLAALGFVSKLSSNWLLHAEAYAQPNSNGAVQIGIEHYGKAFHQIFMLMASPGSVPGTTFVGHTIH